MSLFSLAASAAHGLKVGQSTTFGTTDGVLSFTVTRRADSYNLDPNNESSRAALDREDALDLDDESVEDEDDC